MIDERLAARIRTMSETLAKTAAEADLSWAARGGELAASIGSQVDELHRLIDGKGAELAAALGERGENASIQIAGAAERAVQTLDHQMSGLGALLTQRTDELVAAVNGTASDPVRVLSALSSQLRAEVANSSEAFRSIAEDATQRSGEAIDALLNWLTEQVEMSGASLRDSVERSAEISVGTLAGSGDRLRKELTLVIDDLGKTGASIDQTVAAAGERLSSVQGGLDAKVEEFQRALGGVASQVATHSSEAIDALLKRLAEQVELSGASLRETVARSAETSVGALAGTGEQLRNELTLVIADLGKASATIDQTVETAGERLAYVQSGLAARVEELQRALGGIASQVATLGRLSSATQADAGALASQLAKNAELLAEVAKELAAQQQSLDASLEHRRDSLQALVGDLSGRSEAFEAVLGRFASNVEDSFNRAQGRAQEISAALSSMARGASVAVAGQFEIVRETAAKERERTAQSLQAAIDQTNAQLSSALDRAAERFRQSVGEVKEMASQVQRELDATRQELRRGVLELPQETSETAEAMRRVVSDQIRALKELAALVSDSGAAYDVVEPVAIAAPATTTATVRHERQPSTPAAEPPRSVELPAQREAPSARVVEAIAPPVVVPLAPPRASEPIVASEAAAPPEAPQSAASVPAPETSPQPFPEPAKDRSQANWLSSLLAAALRDESEGAGPPRAYETLEALTHGIAGLIDNAAAVEMWDRWRRGDAKVVSRRLYTESGQQAFDEIRRRYRADTQFRDAAIRYVQEFERLLAKVSQNDRDGSQWRAYLLSNTGKAYTILAHASGRLG